MLKTLTQKKDPAYLPDLLSASEITISKQEDGNV